MWRLLGFFFILQMGFDEVFCADHYTIPRITNEQKSKLNDDCWKINNYTIFNDVWEIYTSTSDQLKQFYESEKFKDDLEGLLRVHSLLTLMMGVYCPQIEKASQNVRKLYEAVQPCLSEANGKTSLQVNDMTHMVTDLICSNSTEMKDFLETRDALKVYENPKILKCTQGSENKRISENFFEISYDGCIYFEKVKNCIVKSIDGTVTQKSIDFVEKSLQTLFNKSPCSERRMSVFATQQMILFLFGLGIFLLIVLMGFSNRNCRKRSLKCISTCYSQCKKQDKADKGSNSPDTK